MIPRLSSSRWSLLGPLIVAFCLGRGRALGDDSGLLSSQPLALCVRSPCTAVALLPSSLTADCNGHGIKAPGSDVCSCNSDTPSVGQLGWTGPNCDIRECDLQAGQVGQQAVARSC